MAGTAPHQESVARDRQRLEQAALAFERTGQVLPAPLLRLEQVRGRRGPGDRLAGGAARGPPDAEGAGREDQRQRLPLGQFGAQDARRPVVFVTGKPPGTFRRILDVAEPAGGRTELAAVVIQMNGGDALVGLESHVAVLEPARARVERTVLRRQRVEVTATQERPEFQEQVTGRLGHRVADDRGLVLVRHEHLLLEGDAVGREDETRDRPERGVHGVLEPGRVDRPGIDVGVERKDGLAAPDRLGDLADELEAPHGRRRGADEKAVIATGVGPRQGARRERAEAVCLEPFAGEGRREIPENIGSEFERKHAPQVSTGRIPAADLPEGRKPANGRELRQSLSNFIDMMPL